MNTAVVNVKVDPKVKKEAHKVAGELGLSLSGLINAYLKQVIRTKTVHFSALNEEPGEYLRAVLAESSRDKRKGRVSPGFRRADDAVAWLKNPKKRYAG